MEPKIHIVAEIGLNFNGDLELAKKSIKEASNSGATAVKFQYYKTEDFICDKSLTWEYQSQGKTVLERQYDMFKRCELTKEAMEDLVRFGAKEGIEVFATPTSIQGVRELASFGVSMMKNGSDYLSHLPLIRAMAETCLTTVISTGMADGWEVDDAVKAFKEAGGKDLVILHCTSLYPTEAQEADICRVAYLKDRYKEKVGFSDHTGISLPAQLAAALGAVFFERHFTLDKDLPGPDHRFSTTPVEFSKYVKAINFAFEVLGKGEMSEKEREAKAKGTLSCVASRDLEKGFALEESQVSFCRPGNGIKPKFLKDILGRVLRNPLKKGDVITWEDLL